MTGYMHGLPNTQREREREREKEGEMEREREWGRERERERRERERGNEPTTDGKTTTVATRKRKRDFGDKLTCGPSGRARHMCAGI